LLGSLLGRQRIVGDYVRHANPPTGPQHALNLGKHSRFVGCQVDDTVADHHVDGRRRQRHVLDDALEELDVGDTGLGRILLRQREHLVGHIQSERAA